VTARINPLHQLNPMHPATSSLLPAVTEKKINPFYQANPTNPATS